MLTVFSVWAYMSCEGASTALPHDLLPGRDAYNLMMQRSNDAALCFLH